MGVQAVVDVLDEESIGAVAPRISVVRAADLEEEGVQARGDNLRARESLDGLDRGDNASGGDVNDGGGGGLGNTRSRDSGLASSRGGLASSRGGLTSSRRSLDRGGGRGLLNNRGLDDSGESLGDGADGGGDGNGHDCGLDGVGRAVRDGRLALGDGLGLSGEDGGDGLELGGDHGGDGSRDGGRLSAGGLAGNLSSSLTSRLGGRLLSRNSSGLLSRSSGGLLSRDRSSLLSGNGGGGLLSRDSGGLLSGDGSRRLLGRDSGSLLSRGSGLGKDSSGSLAGNNSSRSLGLSGRGLNRGGAGHIGRSGDNGSGGGRLGSRGLGGHRLGAGGSVAVERDSGDLDGAALLGLVLRREDDSDILGTTALLVLDGGTGLLASVASLADRAVGHVIVELEIAVELGLDNNGAEGELVDNGTAAERWRLVLLRVASTTNELAAAGARVETTLISVTAALEALEGEVSVVGERTRNEISPVEAGLLLGGTLVVDVLGAGESRSLLELLEM